MKKREARRQIDLLRNIRTILPVQIEGLIKETNKYTVEYNTLMEEYENNQYDTKILIILTGNNDPSLYQLIPLFCEYFKIKLYRIEEKIHFSSKVPQFIRIKKTESILDQLVEELEKK